MLCFAIGWILGYPALRVQHHYLAFVTLAFSTLAFLVFRNEDWLTKGIYGISNIPRPNVMGFATNRPLPFYYFCLGSLALVSLAMWWLIRSPWGRAFVALRENPVTRNTFRKRIVSVWRWAQRQGYLPRGVHTEAEMTEAVGAEKGERTAGRQGYRSGDEGSAQVV